MLIYRDTDKNHVHWSQSLVETMRFSARLSVATQNVNFTLWVKNNVLVAIPFLGLQLT